MVFFILLSPLREQVQEHLSRNGNKKSIMKIAKLVKNAAHKKRALPKVNGTAPCGKTV
jgi:hypothetical protein